MFGNVSRSVPKGRRWKLASLFRVRSMSRLKTLVNLACGFLLCCSLYQGRPLSETNRRSLPIRWERSIPHRIIWTVSGHSSHSPNTFVLGLKYWMKLSSFVEVKFNLS